MTADELAAQFEASAERWRTLAKNTGPNLRIAATARAETFEHCAREVRERLGECRRLLVEGRCQCSCHLPIGPPASGRWCSECCEYQVP